MSPGTDKEQLNFRDKVFVGLASLIVLGLGFAGAFAFFEHNPGLAKLLMQN